MMITRTARVLVVGARADPIFAAFSNLPASAEIVDYVEAKEDLTGEAAASAATCNVVLMAKMGPGIKELVDEMLEVMPKLEWVHSTWAGVDGFLTPKLVAREDIPVTNAKGLFSSSLAEYCMFACGWFSKRARELRQNQAERQWKKLTIGELRGATMGVAGYGDIGQACARLAKAYGMRILAQRRRPQADSDGITDSVFGPGEEELCRLAAECDYLVLAAPLTPDTHHMVNATVLAAVQPGCILINIGRGPIVQEEALCHALEQEDHPLGGAALDVFESEPLSPSSSLWENPQVLLSPHCADQTRNFQESAINLFITNVGLFQEGKALENPVDKTAGY